MLVAITGNIGSGKSVICKLLKTMGYEVYDCDNRAKDLMISNNNLKKCLSELFGENAYLEDGSLNKPHISKCIFSNKEKLQEMNNIVHPYVAEDIRNCYNNHLQNNPNGVFFFESAILFESKFDQKIKADYIICVSSPLELRIERTMKRDNASHESVQIRINNQMSQEEKNRRADFIIYNDDFHSVIAQVEDILRQIV